jgi:hypothetical protein
MRKHFSVGLRFLVIAIVLISLGLTPHVSNAQGVNGLIYMYIDDPTHPTVSFTFDGAFGTFYLAHGEYQQYLGLSPGTYSFSTRSKPGHAVYYIVCGLVVGGTCTADLANRSATITTYNTTNSYVGVGFYRN